MQAIKRFFFTYKKILAIAYRVSPRLLTIVIVSNAIWGLTNLPVLYINKTLIDVVINNLGNPDLTEALRVIAILAFSRGLLEFIRSGLSRLNWTLSITLTDKMQTYLEVITSDKLSGLDIPRVESPEFQDKYKKIQRKGNNSVWGMIEPLSNIPNAIFTIISGIIPIFSFNPIIALIVIAVSIPDIFINARVVKRDYEEDEILNPKYRIMNWVYWHLVDTKNYYENRVLGGTKYLIDKMSVVAGEINDHRYKRRINRARLRFLGDIPGFFLSVGLNVYFFALALLGRITLGTAQLLYSATSTLDNGFATLVNSGLSIYENYLFVNDLTWFLELETQLKHGRKIPAKVIEKGIEFKNVWFKYPGSKKWILKNISFSIKPSENIALVGENGAGKTTLIKLLCGFYRPTKGEILVNGINIDDYDLAKYWAMLGVLFQDFSHYPFSAQESVGIGNPQKIGDLEGIKSAARLTGINDYIEGLTLGYKTPLAKDFEKGVDPSRGQWQRIALARVLFRGSKVIILDEPTSNVDPKAEEEIFEKIINLSKEKILVLISHRFSTVRKADKILNIDRGTIIEQGTHKELMSKNGEYADLFELQAKGYQ
jgi:ATP-binding cassette subfamily B protein